ncbi:MAG TPA: ABC transporter permease [Thermoanaerobaculia bacterium]|nr:ABC transporter permease [Thermoanaerobaculia bacterium]
MDTLWQDLRYGMRALANHKALTAVVVASLALGIGANSAIFSLIDQVVLRLLPVSHPEQLVLLGWRSGPEMPAAAISGETSFDDAGISSTSFSYRTFEHLRRHARTLRDLFAFAGIERLNVSTGGEAELARGQVVSGGYFAALGVPALAGRTLAAADDRAAAPPVAVISHEFWRRAFALDPGALGRTIWLNGSPFTVVGVTARSFAGALELGSDPEITVAVAQQALVMPRGALLGDEQTWWLLVMGRKRPGIPAVQARAELELLFRQSLGTPGAATAHGEAAAAARGSADAARRAPELPRLTLAPGARGLSEERERLAQPLLVLMGLVGLVLAGACANVASLLLSRAAARSREIGMRLALGASRGRLVRQLLTESVLLALLGAACGLLLACWGAGMPVIWLGGGAPPLRLATAPDARILAFTATVALLSGLLFGLAPALQATRLDPAAMLRGGGATPRGDRSRLGKALVVAQVAVALLLVAGAGMFLGTLRNLGRVATGFRQEGVLLFQIDATLNGYHGGRMADFYERVRSEVERLPGVTAATLSAYPLLGHGSSFGDVVFQGYRPRAGEKMVLPEHPVAVNFLSTMEIPILLGRDFRPGDDEHAPQVAVVGESLARTYFPGQNPLGKRFGSSPAKSGDVEIVGVARDAHYTRLDLDGKMPLTIYRPFRQQLLEKAMCFEVRTAGDPGRLVPGIRRVVQALDRNLPLYGIRTQSEQIAETLFQERLFARLASAFGLLATLLAAIGLYGVMSFTVARRTAETGVRMALGASPTEVLKRLLGEALLLAALGVAIGVAAALAAGRLIASLLFGLSASDPAVLILAAGLLVAVAGIAAFLPARRAARTDPRIALGLE